MIIIIIIIINDYIKENVNVITHNSIIYERKKFVSYILVIVNESPLFC